MYGLLLYCLKTGACLAVFYLFFKLLLSRETFHRINRLLVLGAVVLSFVLPLCIITIERELPQLPQPLPFEMPLPLDISIQEAEIPTPFPWQTVAGVVFLMGTAASLVWMACSVAGVLRLVRRGRRRRLDDGVVLVLLDQPVTPFSWGRYIVLSQNDYTENGAAILIHERAHLRMRHSFDLLLTDLAGCLQWFNPAMWLLRRELRTIHEYEADEAVLDSGVDARQYQMLLIRKAVGGRWYSVANSFNHSKLKNRITMMLREKSSRLAGAKTLLVLPLVGLALGAFAETAYVYPKDKGNEEMVTIAISEADSVKEFTGEVVYITNKGNDPSVGTAPAATSEVPQPVEVKADVVVAELEGTYVPKRDSLERVVIRGRATSPVSGDNPLYIVDGVELVDLGLLKHMDILNIYVTKDSLAEAKYNLKARGYNGVVVISTKKSVYSDAEKLRVALAEAQEMRRKYASTTAESKEDHIVYLDRKISEMEAALAAQGEAPAKKVGITTGVGETRVRHPKPGEKNVTTYTGTITLVDFPKDVLFILNGEEVQAKDVIKLEAKKIKRIEVLRDETAVEEYGERGRKGVMKVWTRK